MKRKLAVVLLVLIAGCSKTPQERAKDLFEDGLKLLDKGQIAQADSTFKRILSEAPTSPLGLYGSGLIQERQNQTVDALGIYLQVNKLDRNFAPALLAMGRTFRRLGDLDLASTAYLDCSNLPDSPAVAAVEFAICQCDADHPGSALSAIRVADSIGADKELTRLIRARSLVLQGKRDSAKIIFDQARGSVDKSPRALSLAADYLETRGAVDSAIDLSAQSVKAKGAGYDQFVEHFNRCLRNRYFWEARQTIDRVSRDSISLSRLGLLVPYYLAQGDYYHANKFSDIYMRHANNSIMSYILESDVRQALGDMSTVTGNVSVIPGFALTGKDTTAFARYLLGMVAVRYAEMGDPADIAIKLTSSSGFLKDRRIYRVAWLEQVYKSGAVELFAATLRQFENTHGKEADWLTSLGDIWSDRVVRRYDLAEQYYRAAIQNNASYAPALRALVAMHMRIGEYDKAIKTLDEYKELSDANVDLQLERAYCLAASGQTGPGTTDFVTALPQLKGDLVRIEKMSRLLESKGRPDLDSSVIAAALALNPQNPDAYLLAARRSNDYGNGRLALPYAEKGLAILPADIHLAVQKARALVLSGEKETGYRQFEDILKKDNGDFDANLYFSSLLATNHDQLPRAANLARGAQYWDSGGLRGTANLAYVYLESGQYNLAADATRTFTLSNPICAETQYLYGAALFYQKKKEAREYLQKAVDLGLATQFRPKAQEMLAQK